MSIESGLNTNMNKHLRTTSGGILLLLFALCFLVQFTNFAVGDGVGEDVTKKKDWKKKDIRDYR